MMSKMFTRIEMATHSMTGQKCNSSDKAAKPKLDKAKVAAIIGYNSNYFAFTVIRLNLYILHGFAFLCFLMPKS